jgi:ubiquitin-like protein Pup
MPEQEKKRRPAATTREETTTEEVEAPAPSPQGEKLKAELDDLLDEIDEVLEENAAEFVRNYVQKGGE